MRMPRFRFTVRGVMALVAVTGVVLALWVATARLLRMPANASEALAYVEAAFGHPSGDYEVSVRRIPPGEPVKEQYGGLFEVLYLWRDSRGVETDRLLILVMDDGYRMQMSPERLRPDRK